MPHLYYLDLSSEVYYKLVIRGKVFNSNRLTLDRKWLVPRILADLEYLCRRDPCKLVALSPDF